MDAWTSPNHKALVAFAVHLHHDGEPLSFLLDVIEVAESHTGATLARVFDEMMRELSIEEKVSNQCNNHMMRTLLTISCSFWP